MWMLITAMAVSPMLAQQADSTNTENEQPREAVAEEQVSEEATIEEATELTEEEQADLNGSIDAVKELVAVMERLL